MNYVNESLSFVKNMIYNVRKEIEDVEHELKTNDYSPEGIAMTEKEKQGLEKQLEILLDARDRLEKGSTELYLLSR